MPVFVFFFVILHRFWRNIQATTAVGACFFETKTPADRLEACCADNENINKINN